MPQDALFYELAYVFGGESTPEDVQSEPFARTPIGMIRSAKRHFNVFNPVMTELYCDNNCLNFLLIIDQLNEMYPDDSGKRWDDGISLNLLAPMLESPWKY